MNAVQVQPEQYTDLRRIYLALADGADHPTGLVDRLGLNNTRQVRELLGLLQVHGLIEQFESGDDMLWRTLQGDDDLASIGVTTPALTFEAAFVPLDSTGAGVIESGNRPDTDTKEHTMAVTTPNAPNAPVAAAKPAKEKAPIAPHACKCGCGAQITTKGNYAQGHDARHASNTAKKAAEMKDADKAAKYIADQLPTDKLRAKATEQRQRILDTAEKAKQAAKEKAEAAKKAPKDKPRQGNPNHVGETVPARPVEPTDEEVAAEVQQEAEATARSDQPTPAGPDDF